MIMDSIFLARTAALQTKTLSQTRRNAANRIAARAQSEGNSQNYLVGLRPVENDVDVYFKDSFAWLAS